MAEISYICKRTVVSTKPVQPGNFHSLSVLDRLMEKKHLKIVFYYPSTGKMEIAGEITRRLRESLAEMLNNYPMVTGRLVKKDEEKWIIKCNDAGVRMVEAVAKGNVEEWMKNVDREKELKLMYWEDLSHKPFFWSTFNVQITEFEGGGFAVGLSCHHILADPICATMFVKAWADATSGHKIHGPSLFHLPPRPINTAINHSPLNSLIKYYKSSIENPPAAANSKQKTISLAFSDHEVRAFIAMAQESGPIKNSPSPFAALAGLFWARISKIRGPENNRLVNMSICLDTRKVLHLKNDTFGNCMVCNKVEAEDQRENSVSKAVRAVEKAAAEMDGEDRVRDLIEWLRCNDGQLGTLNNGQDLVCVKLEVAESNLAAFERGIGAVRVSYYVEGVGRGGQVLIKPPPGMEGGFSRVVVVTVAEDEAVQLLEDEVILSLKPSVLIGIDDDK